MREDSSMRKLFSVSVAILPLIMVYKSPIPGVDLGTFWILCISVFLIPNIQSFKLPKNTPLLLFVFYTIVSTLVSMLFQYNINYSLILLRMFKYVILIFFIIFLYYEKYFDFEIAIKTLKIVTLLAVSYIIIQKITYHLTGIILPRGFLNLITVDSYSKNDYVQIAKTFYRPTAFFIEPASFVQYAILYLTYSIFGWSKQPIIHNIKHSIYITIGIILSGSGQGLILLLVVWGLWFLKRVVPVRPDVKKLIIFISVIAMMSMIIPVLMDTPVVAKNLDRIFDRQSFGLGYAGIARTQTYTYVYELKGIFKLIGMGYGNVPLDTYFPSLAYTLYCSGIVGGILLLCFFINMYLKTVYFQKAFVIVYAILIIGSTAFFAINICFYLPFLIYNNKMAYNIKNQKRYLQALIQ